MTSLLNVDDYERIARERLEASIYDYIAGGSWDEITLRENHTAYDKWRLRPRAMVNVEHRDLSVSILGDTLSLPISVAGDCICHKRYWSRYHCRRWNPPRHGRGQSSGARCKDGIGRAPRFVGIGCGWRGWGASRA